MSKQAAEEISVTNMETASVENMTVEQIMAKLKEENHPWLPAIGIFEDDEVFRGWQQAIQDYRRSVDEDPQAL